VAKSTERILQVRIQFILGQYKEAQDALSKVKADIDAINASSGKATAPQGLNSISKSANVAKESVDKLNDAMLKAFQVPVREGYAAQLQKDAKANAETLAQLQKDITARQATAQEPGAGVYAPGLSPAEIAAARATRPEIQTPIAGAAIDETQILTQLTEKQAAAYTKLRGEGVGVFDALNKSVSGAADSTDRATRSTRNMHSTYMGLFTIMMAARQLQMSGAAIQTALVTEQDKYLKAMKGIDPVARAWNDQLQRAEEAHVNIGKTITEQQLPGMEQSTNRMQLMANLAEQYPQVFGVARGAGQTMQFVGGAVGGLAQFFLLLQGLKSLDVAGKIGSAIGGIGPAIGGAGGLAGLAGMAAAPAGVLAGGLGLGLGVNELLARLLPQTGAQTFGKVGMAGLTEAGPLIGLLTGDKPEEVERKTRVAAIAFGLLTGELTKSQAATLAAKAAIDAKNASEAQEADITKRATFGQGVQAYIQSQKQMADLDQQTAEKRSQINTTYQEDYTTTTNKFVQESLQLKKDFDKKQARGDADLQSQLRKQARDFNTNRMKELRDYNKTETEQEKDYHKKRIQEVTDFGEDELRRERDHRRKMQGLEEDHQNTMEDAIANNDARAAYIETRNYEQKRRREEQAYADETGDRNQDLSKRLKELDDNYTEEKVKREDNFKQQLADQDEAEKQRIKDTKEAETKRKVQEAVDYAERQTELAKQYKADIDNIIQHRNDQVAELDATYKTTKDKITGDFNDMMYQLDLLTGSAKTKYQKYFDMMSEQFAGYVGKVGASISSLPGWDATAQPVAPAPSATAGAAIRVGAEKVVPPAEPHQAMHPVAPSAQMFNVQVNQQIGISGDVSNSQIARLADQMRKTAQDVFDEAARATARRRR